MSLCRYQRRQSYSVPVGEARLGGESPLLLQSMANVSTMETDLCVAQALRCASEGCQLFRYTAQGVREATNLGVIAERLRSEGCRMPLVADIHFRSEPAFEALKHVEKVRVNPGNFLHQKASLDDETARTEIAEVFGRFVREAQARHRAIRIGVNHGSLSERILAQYGNTPEGMVASCMEYLEVCDSLGMRDVVISMKASNVLVMTQAVRLLVERMDALDWHYPLHLGVTEAGAGEDGRVKSCIGIASLLVDGLGDTLRVSLSEEPEAELRFGKKLIAYIDQLASFDQTRPIYGSHTYRSVTRDQAQGATTLAHYPAVLTLDSDEKALDVGFDARLEETQLAFVEERQTLQVINLDTPMDRLVQHLEDFVAHWDGRSWLELRGAELDYIYKVRYAVEQLSGRGAAPRILLHYASHARGYDDILIDCATQLGSLLLEGIGNAVAFSAVAMSPKARLDLLNGIHLGAVDVGDNIPGL